MLHCKEVRFEAWRPDFSSSGQASPHWTRLLCGEHQFCNAMEYADWDHNPVQVLLCEHCGIDHCADGGFVRLSRLGGHILWTAPNTDRCEPRKAEHLTTIPAVRRFGGILFSEDLWNVWSDRFASVPHSSTVPLIGRLDLLRAWMQHCPHPFRADDPERTLANIEEHLLASDGPESPPACDRLRGLFNWGIQQPDSSVDGHLAALDKTAAVPETLFLDANPVAEWVAWANVDRAPTLVLDATWVLLPPPALEREQQQ